MYKKKKKKKKSCLLLGPTQHIAKPQGLPEGEALKRLHVRDPAQLHVLMLQQPREVEDTQADLVLEAHELRRHAARVDGAQTVALPQEGGVGRTFAIHTCVL